VPGRLESLGKHEGDLYLNGLTSLSDAAAQSLSRYRGSLELGGGAHWQNAMKDLTDAAAESLSKHKGGDLSLGGLTSLSDAAAEFLSKHEGDLSLYRLTSLSDAAAESLSKHEGALDLRGLTELSDAAAESLGKYKGELSLNKAAKKKPAKKTAKKKAAAKKKTNGEDWKSIVKLLWFVYWIDEEDDNHGINILFGPFATQEAAKLYIEIDFADNYEVYDVSGSEVLLGKRKKRDGDSDRGFGLDFWNDRYASSDQLKANSRISYPNNLQPKSGKRDFAAKSIDKVQVIGIVDGQLGYVAT